MRRGRRWSQPDQVVLLEIERFDLLVPLRRILPRRVRFDSEKEGAVARVFGIDVDLSGHNRGADYPGRAELDLVLDGQALTLEQQGDNVAEQRSLRVDLRRDDHLVGRERWSG